jgi:hypothetical protein
MSSLYLAVFPFILQIDSLSLLVPAWLALNFTHSLIWQVFSDEIFSHRDLSY